MRRTISRSSWEAAAGAMIGAVSSGRSIIKSRIATPVIPTVAAGDRFRLV